MSLPWGHWGHFDSHYDYRRYKLMLVVPDVILQFLKRNTVTSQMQIWLCPVLNVLLQVIHITGRLRLRVSLSHGRTVPSQIMGLVVVAHALPPPTINEVRIDCHMFVTRVNMDLNIIYCENRYFVFVLISSVVCYTLVKVGVCSSLKDFTLPVRLIINPDLIFNGCLDWHQTCFLSKIHIAALIYIRGNNGKDWDTQTSICYN